MSDDNEEYSLEELLSGVAEHNRHAETDWKMQTAPETQPSVRERIASLLDDLPVESLIVVEQLLKLLDHNGRRETKQQSDDGGEHKAFQYPTVTVPASSLREFIGIVSYEGNALDDSEALYDGD